MGRLSATEIALIKAGQPVRQVWTIRHPDNSAHSAWSEDILDGGIWSTEPAATRQRVTKAGRRQHKVWNPHPQDTGTPKAVRYSIECDNRDGYLFQGGGSAFDPGSVYSAEPEECYLRHQIYVFDPSDDSWNEISHMNYLGIIIGMSYVDGLDAEGNIVPVSAVINTEQAGAWDVLRRVFTQEDGDDEIVDDPGGSGEYSWVNV